MQRKYVSLIMTVFNEADTILNILVSYRNQTVCAEEFVIVDGGSSDATAEIVQTFINENPSLNIRLIVDATCSKKHTNAPIARGRNRAISDAKGSIIAVTDAGCTLDEKWLEEITAPFFRADDVDVVSGFYQIVMKSEFQRTYGRVFIPRHDRFLPSSRSVAFKRSCWEKAGGYPEITYTAEDTMFDLNLLRQGCRFVLNKQAIVYWNFVKDKEELRRKLRAYGHGDGYNLLDRGKYLYRMLTVLVPPLLIIKYALEKSAFSPLVIYFFYYHLSRGYIAGIRERLRDKFTARFGL